MSPLEDAFGDIIQKARQGLGMDPEQVAKGAGLSRQTLDRMEACTLTPTREQAMKLAGVLRLQGDKLWEIAGDQWRPETMPQAVLQRVLPVEGKVGSNYRVYGYLVTDGISREAVAIDTTAGGVEMLQAVRDQGLKLTSILLTHTHMDHMGGVALLRRETGAPLRVSPAEQAALAPYWDPARDRVVEEGDQLDCGGLKFRVWSTPGHTPGGVCYHTEKICFVGDSIFAGSTGRSFSPVGYGTLLTALRTKILKLSEGTCLFPGHGPATTVGEERAHNPFFSEGKVL